MGLEKCFLLSVPTAHRLSEELDLGELPHPL